MNGLMNTNNYDLIVADTGKGGLAEALMAAIPMAIASPILAYQRNKTQTELIKIAIESKRRERNEILKTIQILSKYGQLTPELAQQLMVAYYQPAVY